MVSIVLTNYNGLPLLKKYLPENMVFFDRHDITDIIITDDASTDESVAYIRSEFPRIRIVENKQNYGIGASSNRGAQVALHDFVFFLNNDMVVKQLDLSVIKSYFEDLRLFGCSPKIMRYKQGKLINEAPNRGYFKGGWFTSLNDETLFDSVQQKEELPLLWGCGGAFIVRKSLFFELGQFDDQFSTPSYGDDLDLSYRAWKRGWRVCYTERCSCFHMHQSTIKKVFTSKQIGRAHLSNQYLFMWKNLTDWSFILSHMVTVLLKIVTFQMGDIAAMIAALKKMGHIIRFRKKSIRGVRSDRDVLTLFKKV